MNETETPHEWHMRRWKEITVPAWEAILKEAVEQEDSKRAEFARKILKELE